MTLKNMRHDERKKHRITTYLSESEITQVKANFGHSDFTNFSQYHRHLIISAVSEAQHTSTLSNVNEVTSYALTETTQAICKFLIELEKISSSSKQDDNSEVIRLIKTISGNILYAGDLCQKWAKWYRNDDQRRKIVKDIAKVTLSRDELYELISALESGEVKQ